MAKEKYLTKLKQMNKMVQNTWDLLTSYEIRQTMSEKEEQQVRVMQSTQHLCQCFTVQNFISETEKFQ